MRKDLYTFEDELLVVCLFTYNHKNFIDEAIESILMQKTDFDFKLFINDDCSTDGTSEICTKYASRYSDKIIYRRHTPNVGMIKNITGTLITLKSKYVALIEGDDYWIDPRKLQYQVDFLNKNSEFNLAGNNAVVLDCRSINNNDIKIRVFNNKKYIYDEVPLATIVNRWTFPTASIVYRNEKIHWPVFWTEVHNWDYLLQILSAITGKAHYSDRLMSVYRIIDTGNTNNPHYNVEKTLNRQIELLKKIDTYTNGLYKDILSNKIEKNKKELRKFLIHKKFPFLKYISPYRYFRFFRRELKNL
jgi:Glycosyltransferases involved in cell wall biogenesis